VLSTAPGQPLFSHLPFSGPAVDLPAFHDEYNLLGRTDVLERIAGNGHDVGELPDHELAAVSHTAQFSGVDLAGVPAICVPVWLLVRRSAVQYSVH
jgi:hypothetical protein